MEGREDEWIIAAKAVINSVFEERGPAHDTAKKAGEILCFKTAPSKGPEVLQSCMFELRKGSRHPGSPTY